MLNVNKIFDFINISLFETHLDAPKIEHLTGTDNSFLFDWEGAYESKRLELLRKTTELDLLLSSCNTDLDKIKLTTFYVHQLSEHDGWNDPQTRDPVVLVKRASHGESFRCVEFSIVMASCLRAINIPARILGLKTKDVETREFGAGHVVVEAFVDNQWIFIDPQACFIPSINGKLLNAVDLCYQLNSPNNTLVANELKNETGNYKDWVKNYLYYFDTFISPEKEKVKVMLVPLNAKKPTVFQKNHPLTDLHYTNSVTAFYAWPN